jgi:MFS family permease
VKEERDAASRSVDEDVEPAPVWRPDREAISHAEKDGRVALRSPWTRIPRVLLDTLSHGAPPTPKDRRPFLALMAANAVAQIGHMMTSVAVPWLVLETTGSPAAVGLTGAAIAIGAVVPSLLGGPIVDRVGQRRVSIAADLVCGLTVVIIPVLQLAGVLQFWQILLLVFLLSSFNAQGDTGRFGLIPALAARAAMPLERSNATDRGIARAGQLFGPLLAGVLIPFIGPSNVLIVDAATFGVSATLVRFGVPSAAAPALPVRPAERRNYRADMSEGLRYLLGNRLILSVILLCLLGNFFDLPLMTVVLPIYAKQMFGSPQSLGLMLGSVAAGTLLGTVVFGLYGRRFPKRETFLWGWFLAILITYGALAARAPLPLLLVAGIAGGIAAGPINPILETVVQQNTPSQLMGRVFGAFLAFSQAAIPFGAAIAGLVIQGAGLIPTIATGGLIYLSMIVLMFFNPALHRMNAPGAAPEPAVAGPPQAQASLQARHAATMKAGLS